MASDFGRRWRAAQDPSAVERFGHLTVSMMDGRGPGAWRGSRVAVAAVLILVIISNWNTLGWWAFVPIMLILLAALFAESMRARRIPRPGRCLFCRYDLSGVPESVPVAVSGVSLGPRRCPECGEPWPKVPGPAAPVAARVSERERPGPIDSGRPVDSGYRRP